MSPLHEEVNQQDYTRAVFDPLLPCPNIIQHYVTSLCLNEPWHYRPWQAPLDTTKCIDRLTVWFPPPELVRQVIIFILETWVERPLTTSALFFVPRILLSFWRGLSKHLIELDDCIRPELTCLSRPPTLPIPVVVLFLPRRMFGPTRNQGWTHLPLPTLPARYGTGNRPQRCAGCHQGYSPRDKLGMIKCHFFDSGFPFDSGVQARPCHSWYHPKCFRVGHPFTTRRAKDAGLCLPDKGVWDPFICEACTVRAMCNRELHGRQD